jgi:hypothetical protein
MLKQPKAYFFGLFLKSSKDELNVTNSRKLRDSPSEVAPRPTHRQKEGKVSREPPGNRHTIPPPKLSRVVAVQPSDLNQVESGPSKKIVCDKCDGKHETSLCPYYKKDRDQHPDAQKNFYKKLGGVSTLPGQTLERCRVVRQPGDGSCLFHSMSYGLRDGSNASSLRRDICSFIDQNPAMRIADTPLSDWIRWDSGGSVSSYTSRMRRGAWGGGIEMASLSLLKGVNVHVYERSRAGGFVRISAFDHPSRPEGRKTVQVLYCGGVHYGVYCHLLIVNVF